MNFVSYIPSPLCMLHSILLLLSGPQLLNELYHEDKGINLVRAVFLSPKPPTLDVQHLLATHHASAKLTYLQGSPFRIQVRCNLQQRQRFSLPFPYLCHT